jgi:predicted flap endonuclease-1-like 5' DNA nuclease
MSREGFQSFLKRGGRSPSAVKRCLRYVREFEQFLAEGQRGTSLDEAQPDDLEAFVAEIEREPKASAKTRLWAISYYYEFTSDEDMRRLAAAHRAQRIKRQPFSLKDFRGVDPRIAEALAAAGIRNVQDMRAAGRTPADRQALARETGVPPATILELVKLSDLARIPGIKSIRARLYHDAGVDTIDKMAGWDPLELRAMLLQFVEETGFDGIAPLPKEAAFSVARAKELPRIIEY